MTGRMQGCAKNLGDLIDVTYTVFYACLRRENIYSSFIKARVAGRAAHEDAGRLVAVC
jgi:hypothetical protein